MLEPISSRKTLEIITNTCSRNDIHDFASNQDYHHVVLCHSSKPLRSQLYNPNPGPNPTIFTPFNLLFDDRLKQSQRLIIHHDICKYGNDFSLMIIKIMT